MLGDAAAGIEVYVDEAGVEYDGTFADALHALHDELLGWYEPLGWYDVLGAD